MPRLANGESRRRRRRLILHVGLPKCGSTFLQVALRNSAPALATHGVAYPHDNGPHPGNAGAIAALPPEKILALFGECHTLVLSHEDLFANPAKHAGFAERVRQLGISTRVVAFLRPFSEFVFGDYSQHMKQNFDAFLAAREAYKGLDFDGFAARRAARLRPAEHLSAWADLFPGQKLVLEPSRQIAATFRRLLPRAPIDWNVPKGDANPSLSVAACDEIAAALRDPAVKASSIQRRFLRAWITAHRPRRSQPDSGRTAARIAAVEALFAPHNAALLDRFGFDNRLPVVADPLPEAALTHGGPG